MAVAIIGCPLFALGILVSIKACMVDELGFHNMMEGRIPTLFSPLELMIFSINWFLNP
jgi:hypothetical protein